LRTGEASWWNKMSNGRCVCMCECMFTCMSMLAVRCHITLFTFMAETRTLNAWFLTFLHGTSIGCAGSRHSSPLAASSDRSGPGLLSQIDAQLDAGECHMLLFSSVCYSIIPLRGQITQLQDFSFPLYLKGCHARSPA